ncbi:hypothetical protein KY345_04495 [Candidatus Woesearchaeota archaeon]|nr:hypothetical protein [Candidatus Woesearchaeota archaeon]
MLDKIKEEIEDWEYHELKELQKELTSGSNDLNRIISRKIKDFEQDTGCICPVCNSVIDSSKPESFTLIFGPKNLKKKASFCAVDCLQYFISKLKKVKEVEQK